MICALQEVDIKSEINPEIDFSCYETNTQNPAEVTNNVVKISDDLVDNDQHRSVFHSDRTNSAKSKPPKTYSRKRSAPRTNYECKSATKEKSSTDGKTLCTTCGALVRIESVEQHKNIHLGTKFIILSY